MLDATLRHVCHNLLRPATGYAWKRECCKIMFFDGLSNLDEVLKQCVCELLWKTFELGLSSIPNFKLNEDIFI